MLCSIINRLSSFWCFLDTYTYSNWSRKRTIGKLRIYTTNIVRRKKIFVCKMQSKRRNNIPTSQSTAKLSQLFKKKMFFFYQIRVNISLEGFQKLPSIYDEIFIHIWLLLLLFLCLSERTLSFSISVSSPNYHENVYFFFCQAALPNNHKQPVGSCSFFSTNKY